MTKKAERVAQAITDNGGDAIESGADVSGRGCLSREKELGFSAEKGRGVNTPEYSGAIRGHRRSFHQYNINGQGAILHKEKDCEQKNRGKRKREQNRLLSSARRVGGRLYASKGATETLTGMGALNWRSAR